MTSTEHDIILSCPRVSAKNLKKCKSSLVGGDSAAADFGSEDGGGRKMEYLDEAKFQFPVRILQNSEFCQKLQQIRPEPRSDDLFFIFTRPEPINLD